MLNSFSFRTKLIALFFGLVTTVNANVTFECFDSRTGYLLTEVIVGKTVNGRIIDDECLHEVVTYCFVARGYSRACKSLQNPCSTDQRHYRVFLDPLSEPVLLNSHTDPSAHTYRGFITDIHGRPLSGLEIFMNEPITKSLGRTDQNGYFNIPIALEETQQEIELSFLLDGVVRLRYSNFLLWKGGEWNDVVQIDLDVPVEVRDQGRSRTTSDSGLEPALDQLLPKMDRGARGGYSVCDGEMISIGFGGSIGSTCSNCSNCTVSNMYPMDTYSKHVIAAEWLGGNWQNLSGISESYRAAAVAIRTYASFFITTPLCAAFDLCAGPACQAFSTQTNPMMNTAVDYTTGYFLWDTPNGEEAFAQYSSENNNRWISHCVQTPSSSPQCGNGYFGRSSSGSPCFADPPGTGYIQFGHGKGLSQVGSARWATGLNLGDWCSACGGGSTIYGYCASAHGYGTKNWQQILNHYYSYYELISCGSSGCPQPTNDGCLSNSAIQLPVSTTACTQVTATTCGATSSGFSACIGNSDDDIFFRFTAISSTALVSVLPTPGFDPVLQGLTSPCGGNMQVVAACINDYGTGASEVLLMNNLTPLTEYFVRVWHYGTGSGITGNFDICVLASGSGGDEDITVTNTELSVASVEPGGTITASANHNYAGDQLDADLPSFDLAYLLSTNCSLDGSDVYLGGDISGLGSDDPTNSESEALTIPAGTTPGNYYILFVADYDNELAEGSGEANNVQCVPLTVIPPLGGEDITVTNTTLSSGSVAPGGTIIAAADHNYSGSQLDADLPSFDLGYLLSTNCILDGGDVLLDTDISGLGADDPTNGETQVLTIPSGTSPGNYFILFVADYDNELSEGAGEANNVVCVPLTICSNELAPLLISSLPIQVCRGSTVNIEFGITNDGCGDLSSVDWNYYQSSNPLLDAGDNDIGGGTAANILVGETFTNDISFSVPSGTPAGTYYFLLEVDPNNEVSEGPGEANNILAVPVLVIVPGTPCNDGIACTTDDQLNANCDCVGTLQDADADGVCDANDECPGTTAGTGVNGVGCSCTQVTVDDGNPCTLDQCTNGNVTHTLQDSDADGVCDANDDCPGTAAGAGVNIAGCSCTQVTVDDGNPCTLDQCTNGNVTHTLQDSDADGVCDAIDDCPGTVAGAGVNIDGCSCVQVTVDDGNPCTLDQCANGNVTHTLQDSDADGVCDANDDCPGTAAGAGVNIAGCSCAQVTVDDGNPCTLDQCTNGNVTHTLQDSDADGVCDANDDCPGTVAGAGVNIDGCACAQVTVDDGEPCTLDQCTNGNVTHIFQDSDSDGTCDAEDLCPGGPEPGSTCDDDNPCTTNDIWDATCTCIGSPLPVPGAITGPLAVGMNEEVTYSIDPIPDASGYEWTLLPGWTGVSVGTTITVITDGLNDTDTLCVHAIFDGCPGPDTCIVVTFIVGIGSDESISWFTIQPNPSTGSFQLTMSATNPSPIEVSVFDALGQLVHAPVVLNKPEPAAIHLENEADGVYFLRATRAGESRVFQVLIQH